MRSLFITGMLTLVLLGCSERNTLPQENVSSEINEKRVSSADSEPGNWFTTGRTFGETHYSPLTQINSNTISTLGFAWNYDTGTTRGLEATPIVVDGKMYTSGTWGSVYSLDAKLEKNFGILNLPWINKWRWMPVAIL